MSEVEAGAFSTYIESRVISTCCSKDWPCTVGAPALHRAGEGQCGLESTLAVITLQLSGTWLITREHVKKAHRCHKNHGL